MPMANRKKLSRSTFIRRSTACCVKDYHNILFTSDVDRVDRVDLGSQVSSTQEVWL